MPEEMNEQSFTVLRDATPPEPPQRRQSRGGTGRGCFAGFCKCLGRPQEDYGVNKARPHVIAQVGVNASALSSPKSVHGANGGTNGSAFTEAGMQGPQEVVPAMPRRQATPLPPQREGMSSQQLEGSGIRTAGVAINGKAVVLKESRLMQPSADPAIKPLPQLPPKPAEAPPPNRESDVRTDGALILGSPGTATPRVTHLQSAPATAAASMGPPQNEEEYVEKDEVPLAPARNSIRRVLDQHRYDDEQDEDGYTRQLEAGLVSNAAREWVLADPIEQLVVQEVEAVQHCMLVSHETSDEMGCLLTLRAAPRSAGVALDHAGLQLASKSGSEAATVMSARQCALFRRGLALELEYLNHQIVHFKVQIRRLVLRLHSLLCLFAWSCSTRMPGDDVGCAFRFQVLRESLTASNGMLHRTCTLTRSCTHARTHARVCTPAYSHTGGGGAIVVM